MQGDGRASRSDRGGTDSEIISRQHHFISECMNSG
jgi:hypothetical protein